VSETHGDDLRYYGEMDAMQYAVVVKPDIEDGGFVVECPAIPGCVSEGDTIEEAMANIRDAIAGCLAVLRDKGQPLPLPADAILATVEVAG
jgi:predicted RNase H-like HicB family nuclease